MTKRMTLGSLVGLALCSVLTGEVLAADKKAEGDLRWGLNYCGKVIKDIERVGSDDLSASQIFDALKRWQSDHAKFLDYVKKAEAADASVTESSTVFDRKTQQTFAQAYQRCLKVASELETFRQRRDGLNQDFQEKKRAEAAQGAANENRRTALEAAADAIQGECAGFVGWGGSSGLEERVKAYEEKKRRAVAILADIVKESLTVDLKTRSEAPGTQTTKSIGEWFTFCDGMMPNHLATLRQKETEAAVKEQAQNQERKAAENKIRAEGAAKFKSLLGATTGDRRRVLQAKGFLPWWPRGVDLAGAPVWKWEVNITHQPNRCESYHFQGEKLLKNTSSLGACP